jgi:hypothetical protein
MSAGIFLNPATMSLPLRQNKLVAPARATNPAHPLSRIAYGQLSRPMPMNTLIWIAAQARQCMVSRLQEAKGDHQAAMLRFLTTVGVSERQNSRTGFMRQ